MFSLAVRKNFCIKTFFIRTNVFSKGFPSTKCEVLTILLKLPAKSQKQIAQNPWILGKFCFFKKFDFHDMSFGHRNCIFVNSAVKFLQENLEKNPHKTEEGLEKNSLFPNKMCFIKTLLWTLNCNSENRAQKFSVKSPNRFCSKSKNSTKNFCLKDIF